MLFKLKRNKFGLQPSSLPHQWIEVLAITPVTVVPLPGDAGMPVSFKIESLWTCRTEQGIRQIPAGQIEQEIALELFVDEGMTDSLLREKKRLLTERAGLLERRIIGSLSGNDADASSITSR